MRVLIIGGTAFTGPHIVRGLHARGHQVTLFHRGRTTIELPPGAGEILCPQGTFGDRSYFAAHTEALRAAAPDVVLDMIAATQRDAQTVMDLFRGTARRIVAISSQDVYRAYGLLLGSEEGAPDATPLTEDAPLRTHRYPYRATPRRTAEDPQRWMDEYDKILVEQTVMGDPELPGTILRYPMVYGPQDRQHRLHEYLQRMDAGRPRILLEEKTAAWRWTRGYVADVAHAVVLAIENEAARDRIYNVGESTAYSTAEWIARIGDAADWTGEIVALPRDAMPVDQREGSAMMPDLVTSSARIRAELGYAEVAPADEALRRTVAWERANPPQNARAIDLSAEDAAWEAWIARRP